MLNVKLVHGSEEFSINTGRYHVGREFLPPGMVSDVLYADGSWANKAGATVIDKRPLNRSWTFPLDFDTATIAETTRALRDLQSFIDHAGDPDVPLYLYVNPNAHGPDPLWGQYNAGRRYEILHGSVRLDSYPIAPSAEITFELKPYALGTPQRLASAKGGIYENLIGASDGKSRGLMVNVNATNKLPNSTFGHSTWNNGWTAGANLVEMKNIDPAYCFPGMYVSARLTARGSTNNTYTRSINAGNANKHSLTAYIMLPNKDVPTSDDCELVYGSTKATTFYHIGNGVYLMVAANFSGINAATATGIVVKNGRTIYLLGMQFEEGVYFTPLMHGEMLGCAFDGVAWESSTSRSISFALIPEGSIDIAQGSLRIIVRPWVDETHPLDMCFFSCGTGSFKAWFEADDDKIYFSDGTNTISSTVQSWAPFEDVIELEFCWAPGRLAIYKNGVAIASGNIYNPPAAPTFASIGSYMGANSFVFGEILGLATFGEDRSTDDILADYTNHKPILDSGQRLETIPWLWTIDGQRVVSDYYDATHTNLAVAGGVPGTMEAETTWLLVRDSNHEPIISCIDLEHFLDPKGFLLFDFSGTVDADSCGGAFQATSVGTSYKSIGDGVFSKRTRAIWEALAEKEIYLGARLSGQITQLHLQLRLFIWSGEAISSDISVSKTRLVSSFLLTPPIVVPSPLIDDEWNVSDAKFSLWAAHDTVTENVNLDFFAILPMPIMKFGITPGASGDYYLYVEDGQCTLASAYGVARKINNFPSIIGKVIELRPDRYNELITFCPIGDQMLTPSTLTYSRVTVTPRWSLL